MNKSLKLSTKWFFLSALILLACKDDEQVDPNSPSSFIKQSEELTIPSEVAVTAGTRVATYYAKGVQIYSAQLKSGTVSTYEWIFVAPSADLYDESNQKIGVHFSGPTWQLSASDKINAQAFSPAKTKSVDANSIDWLLLMPKSNTTPTGIFKDVTSVQRIATTGGKAPSTAPTSATETIGVEYTAVYRFTKN